MPPGKRISPKEALAALCGISLILGVMALIANAGSVEFAVARAYCQCRE